jgi:RNA polymerase sigma-70 factor (ECF subfamily)
MPTTKALEEKFFHTYNTYADQIFRFIFYKVNDREKAKDFTQETFMKTWMYISECGDIENTKAFLYRVAGNLVIDEYRRRGRVSVGSLDSLIENGYDIGVDEKESMINRIDGSRASLLINELPKVYAEALSLRYIKDLGIVEIASIIGKSANLISVRITRGMKRMRELVAEKQMMT